MKSDIVKKLDEIKPVMLVVFYYPNNADIGLLRRLQQANVPIYLIDNTPADDLSMTGSYLFQEGLKWLHRGENIGLSRAYNRAFAQAKNDGFSHVVIFDQDTFITQETLDFITTSLTINSVTDPLAGMINFSQNHPERKGQRRKRLLVVNSATAFNVECHGVVEGFNEVYFVDCVDYDYCLRCLNAKRSIYQVQGTPGLDHYIGQPGRSFRLFGKTLYARDYGARRNSEIFWGHLRLLRAGMLSLQAYWTFAIFRSFILFVIGRLVTCVTFVKTGKS